MSSSRDNSEYTFTARVRIPEVNEKVHNAQKINEILGTDQSIELVRKMQNGDFSFFTELESIAMWIEEFEVHQYRQLYALVIKSTVYGHEWGANVYNYVVYYDGEIGDLISPRQYANKCGIAEDDIVEQYNEESAYNPASSIYQTAFYLDSDGKLHTLLSSAAI